LAGLARWLCGIMPAIVATTAPVHAAGRPVADRPVHDFHAATIAPDGQHIATIESDAVPNGSEPPPRHLFIRTPDGGARQVTLPCRAGPDCLPSSPSWRDDSHLAFVLSSPGTETASIYSVYAGSGDAGGGAPHRLARFAGALGTLRSGPHGALAVLATAHPHKKVGATEAAAPMAGEIGTDTDEQRIAILRNGVLRLVSPADLFVYEFDWRPDGTGLVAKLIAVSAADGAVSLLHAPDDPHQQLAHPVVSPDGRSVAYIAGWMSDFGSDGGDAFLLPLDRPGAKAVDLTPGLHATITSLDWGCRPGLTATALASPRTEVLALQPAAVPDTLWSGQESIGAGSWNLSLACAGGHSAAYHQTFVRPPELEAGSIGHWHDITHVNAGMTAPAQAVSVTWKSNQHDVQGWLLTPLPVRTGKRPLLVQVHGGPQAADVPSFDFLAPRALDRALLAGGYDLFLPNYRGSFGQGEAFTAADIDDFGGGDFRDIMAGLDAVEQRLPVNGSRLGIFGGSYGGYMSMWAVTQTHRFKAAASHAGISNWVSEQGEAPQMTADLPDPVFGTLVYDDPRPQLRASPITHMRGVRTPMLITVGERDVECPLPQSQEYYQALRTLGVPTSFVVYAGEGHGFRNEADRADERRRTVAWFDKWLLAPTETAPGLERNRSPDVKTAQARSSGMSQDKGSQESDKTTANTPISGIDPGGTRPAPASGKPAKRPEVQSGDQNTDRPHGTDRYYPKSFTTSGRGASV